MKLLFRYFFRTLRIILGPFMLLSERFSAPKSVERSAEAQQQVNEECKVLQLYQFRTCPFCIKVRREIKRLSLNIATCDAQYDPAARAELQQGGGKITVPCLRIEQHNGSSQWLYESDDIVTWLRERFAVQQD